MKKVIGIMGIIFGFLLAITIVSACETNTKTCSDSDGGKNASVFGTVTLTFNSGDNHRSQNFDDVCTTKTFRMYNKTTQKHYTITKDFVKEYFCSGKEKKSKLMECKYGCAAGACLPEDPSVPEFSTVGAMIALLGASGIFLIRRKK